MNECQLRHITRQDFPAGGPARIRSTVHRGTVKQWPLMHASGALLPGNNAAMVSVALWSGRESTEKRTAKMATDYDEVRSDVKESQDSSLEALKSASAPDARSVVTELDEADALDEGLTPGGEIVSEELIV